MTTAAEVRAWARETGHDVPDRGRLQPELWAEYAAAHDDNAVDMDLPVIDVDLPADEAPEIEPEVRPSRRRARQATKPAGKSFLGKLLTGDPKPARGRSTKKQPRVSLEKLISRGYGLAGRLLTPVSPAASRCLVVQAPMAGVMLNDVMRDTVVDRLLQPVARAEEKLDVVFALAVPPLACMGLELTSGLEPTAEVLFRRGILQQMLRESLRTGLELSEKYAEQISASVQREAKYSDEVDTLIATIFGIVPAGPEATPGAAAEREPEMAAA